MAFHGDLPTEERTSDSGSKYLVKVDPNAKPKNKALGSPDLVTSDVTKVVPTTGEEKPVTPVTPAKGK